MGDDWGLGVASFTSVTLIVTVTVTVIASFPPMPSCTDTVTS